MTHEVPPARIRQLNDGPIRGDRPFVLYWMIAARRPRFNFALQRAVEHARVLAKPLIVIEALRCNYRWASDRLHTFVMQGMADNARSFAARPCLYVPYIELDVGQGKGFVEALAGLSSVVVSDDSPAFFVPRMLAAAGRRLDVRLEAVDSNGLLPLSDADRAFVTAFSFRAFLQKRLRPHLESVPLADPLDGTVVPTIDRLPAGIADRWPAATAGVLARPASLVATLPIDHRVGAVAARGGLREARELLARFLSARLERYPDERNEPDRDLTSGLSAHLHFGHISAHEIFEALMTREGWTSRRLSPKGGGRREGWWGASRGAEAFLDQLVTWRELGFNTCARRDDYDQFESLPAWARATLAAHARDRRPITYTLAQFEAAATHDALWNAAQRQLLREGRMHNYLRMLWGKKILEWSASPREALDVMIALNDKYALDGRDPNSCSGIFWCLGRYDRAWGPERPIFGTVRYMSSENTARKLAVREYLRRYAE